MGLSLQQSYRCIESRKISSLILYNKMVDLLTSPKAEAASNKTGALVTAAAKVYLYVSGDGQPDLEFFKAVRLLDPNQFKLL